jgi:hypothetical protein
MKKISTVVAKQIRNISEQKLTIGFDLGDRSRPVFLGDPTVTPISVNLWKADYHF